MGVLAHKYWTPKRLTWALAGILATAMLIAGFSLRLSTTSTTTVVNRPRVVVTAAPKPTKSAKPTPATSTGPFATRPEPAAAPTPAQPQRPPATVKPQPTHATPRPTSTPTSRPTPTPTPKPTCIRVFVASVCR